MKKSALRKETSDKSKRKSKDKNDVEVRRYIEEHLERQRQKAMEGDLADLCF